MNEITFENEVLNAEPTPVNPAELPQIAPAQPPKNNPLFKKNFCFASITYFFQAGIVLVFLVVGILRLIINGNFSRMFDIFELILSGNPENFNELEFLMMVSNTPVLTLVTAVCQTPIYLIWLLFITVMYIMLFAKCNKPFLAIPLSGIIFTPILLVSQNILFNKLAEGVHDMQFDIALYPRSDIATIISGVSFLYSHIIMALAGIITLIFVVLLALKGKNPDSPKSAVQKLWFIPCLLRLFAFISFPFEYIVNAIINDYGYDNLSVVYYALMISIGPAVIYLFIVISEFCLLKWLANPYKKPRKEKKKPQPVQPVQPVVQYVPVMQPAAEPNAAQQLMEYKNLLDMGAITQEEFEAKKKQILGL